MKKIALVLTLLLAFGFGAFAQDGTPITVTGTLSFTVGSDTQPDTPNLPVISAAKAATATMTIASADEKVSASIGLNLLADPTLGGDVDMDVVMSQSRDAFLGVDTVLPGAFGTVAYAEAIDEYNDWLKIEDYVAFFNDMFDDEDASEEAMFEAQDLTDFVAVLNGNATISPTTASNIAAKNADADGVDLDTPVAIGKTAGDDEWVWTDAKGDAVPTLEDNVLAELAERVDEAIDTILKDATDLDVRNIDTFAELNTYINGLDDVEVNSLSTGDKDLITEAVEYYIAYFDATMSTFIPEVTNTIALTAASFITSASFTVKEIGGVVDLSGAFTGGHVSVGAIKLDTSGHQDDTIKSYPSITASLSSGVVEGLSASVTFYSDDNDAANEVAAVADTWYTWVNETVDQADPVEPALGLKVSGGYTMAIGEDMSVGATAAVGMYDLAGGEDLEFGFTVAPSFSGFGATVGIQFDYGLGMMAFGVDASYSIMGITPSVYFDYIGINADDDLVIAYVTDDEYTSGMAAVKGEGGIALGLDVTVDVGQFIGMAATVGGGFDYSGPSGGDAIIAYDANLSITPLAIDLLSLTVSGGISDVGIWLGTKQGVMGWNAGLSVNLIPASVVVAGGVNQKWLADPDDVAVQKFGWDASVTYTHSIAKIVASVGSAWDNDDDEDYITWSIKTSVTF